MIRSVTIYLLGESNPQLERVEVFLSDGQQLIVHRGSQSALASQNISSTFSWSRAVRAITVLLLRVVIHRADSSIAPSISGEQGSLAASLDSALSKETQWLCDMFGANSSGRSTARKIMIRSNPERKRPGPVVISFNAQIVNETKIKVFSDGQIVDGLECRKLLTRLEGQSPTAKERARPSLNSTAATSLTLQRDLPVVLLSPSDGANPFYSHIIRTVAQKFPGQVTPIIPEDNFDPHHMWLHVQRYLAEVPDSLGIILIPDQPELHRDKILKLYRQSNISLVLFDVDLCREDVQKDLPPFVGGDEEHGGFLAAQLAIEYFERNRIARPKVLVVRGATTNWESKRSGSFAKSLRETIPDAEIFESPKLHYDRTQSRRYLLDHIAFQPKPEKQYHLIFSCNDDMALGCRTALLELNRLGAFTKISTKIIGYDGMREVQELIRFDDQIILGTIDVQLDKQLELLCKILRQELYLKGSCQSRYLVKPRVVKASSFSLIAAGE